MEVSGTKEKETDLDLTSSQRSSGDGDKLYCLPCEQDGSRVPAYGYCQDCFEHLCEICFKSHKKPAPCRNHILLDKTQMPQTPQMPQTIDISNPNDLTETCNKHKSKVIEYFCRQHKTLGCSPCMTTKHRSCEIDYIPDVSASYLSSPEYQSLLQCLESLHGHLKKMTESAQENKTLIQENHEKVREDIQRFRQEINITLDNWEALVSEEAENIFSQENKNADLVLNQCREMTQKIERKQYSLNKLQSENKHNMLYIHGKRNEESKDADMSEELTLQEEIHVNSYTFQPNLALQNLLQTETNIGKLSNNKKEVAQCEQSKGNGAKLSENLVLHDLTFEGISAELSCQIDVKTPSDKYGCRLTGIDTIGEDNIVVADYSNKNIKIIDVKQKKVLSVLNLSSEPWDVALLPGAQFAVTLPNEKLIQIVSFINGLCNVRQLAADKSCYGIAFSDGLLTVGMKEGRVQLINLKGTVLKSYESGRSNVVHYVEASKSNGCIYASDGSSIICFKNMGEVVDQYTLSSLVNAGGFAVLDDGSLVVCASDKCSIQLISADLEHSRKILQGKGEFPAPYSLGLEREGRKLYTGSGIGTSCSIINVYTLK
ncbi:uncharacterized protein LOC123534633 [Mercenaria mercenaria]|uniref:uncharacterized protein LOC123534633 n=1 Tax=Mercenaria mercenaria TaxID=6596 RepID=UPI00234E6D0E|nr:uncharacterized protein LOC123534633 [Mercenaria mercenaria]XP_053375830.1 uncharacterized protein LOC123534633 [Mercenaria mercenaria]